MAKNKNVKNQGKGKARPVTQTSSSVEPFPFRIFPTVREVTGKKLETPRWGILYSTSPTMR